MIGDFLAKRLAKRIEKKTKKRILTKEGLKPLLSQIKLTLLEADINIEVVNHFIEVIKQKAINKNVIENATPYQTMIKIVHMEIKNLFGKVNQSFLTTKKFNKILLFGLQGVGKTTTAAKLCYFLKNKKHKKVLLVNCDLNRVGSLEQVQELAKTHNLNLFKSEKKDIFQIAKDAKKYAFENNFDYVIFDSAGRIQVDTSLMEELKKLAYIINPDESFLVVDSLIGQEVINVTKTFNKYLNLSGVIATKIDGNNKGGPIFSIVYLTKLPIKFIATGEHINNLELFHPKRMADRVLGMGDIDSLFESIKENLDQRTIKTTLERMMRGQFDLQDYLLQLKQMKKMGNVSGFMKNLPNSPFKMDQDTIEKKEAKLKIAEIILSSTTQKERRNPKLMKYLSRKNRILKGSGRTEKELMALLNEYEKIKKNVLNIKQKLIANNYNVNNLFFKK